MKKYLVKVGSGYQMPTGFGMGLRTGSSPWDAKGYATQTAAVMEARRVGGEVMVLDTVSREVTSAKEGE